MNEQERLIREKAIDEILEMLWKMDLDYFDKQLKAIRGNHAPLEEEFRYKCEAIDKVRSQVEEMK